MWQEDLASELRAAKPTERKSIMTAYRERTGLSNQQLYRIAAEYGFESGRKRRADSGVLNPPPPPPPPPPFFF
jgi:hypothetical protein